MRWASFIYYAIHVEGSKIMFSPLFVVFQILGGLQELLRAWNTPPNIEPGFWAMFLTKVAWYQEIVLTGLVEGEFKVWECDKADYEDKHESFIPW